MFSYNFARWILRLPWLGDVDVNGGASPSKEFCLLCLIFIFFGNQQFLPNCGLSDAGYHESKFTWCNNRHPNVFDGSSLEMLVNQAWLDFF